MLQVGLVEALVVDMPLLAADVLVALVDLAGLREAGALLVHRLGREQRPVLALCGPGLDFPVPCPILALSL